MATTQDGPELDQDAAAALAERIVESAAATFDTFAIYLGDRLGFYRALAGAPATSAELARRTQTVERYAREWLEQQAVTGILTVADASAAPEDRRYALPEGYREVFTEPDSLNHLAPFARLVVAVGLQLPAVLDIFRNGGGLSWDRYGPDAREAQGDVNRPLFTNQLGSEHLPAIPGVHARLTQPGARVADIGCGVGWSAIAIARSYPDARVDGYDSDAPSIAQAREHAAAAGVADRVTFHSVDAADPSLTGHVDVATAFECIHDLSDPVGVLRTMHRLVGDDGLVLVVDERVAETFTAPGDLVERIMYGWSITCCLAGGLAEPPAAGTGTVMRPGTLRRYAEQAGFRSMQVLPIDNDFFRYYLLAP